MEALTEVGAISDSANKLLEKYMLPAMRKNKKWRIREQTILLFHSIVSTYGYVHLQIGAYNAALNLNVLLHIYSRDIYTQVVFLMFVSVRSGLKFPGAT